VVRRRARPAGVHECQAGPRPPAVRCWHRPSPPSSRAALASGSGCRSVGFTDHRFAVVRVADSRPLAWFAGLGRR